MQLLKGLKLLEDSYNSKNWDGVKSSYFLISGEELLDIGIDENSLEKAKKLHTKASAKSTVAKKPRQHKKVKVDNPGDFKADMSLQKESSEPRQARTTAIKFVKNQFVDDGKLAIEDKIIDKKLRKGWKKPEKRQKHSYKEVNCSTKGCREIVNIDPSLYLPETSYFCNTCLGKKR